jgi:hypothetical protein
MSHHASGPNFGFPRGDARLDMTDLYAFTKPGDPAKSIIVLNVHPSFRLDSPEPTTKERLAPAKCLRRARRESQSSSILKRKRGGASLTIFVKPENGGSEVKVFTEGLS